MAGDQVDDAGRHPGLLEQLHRQVGGELLGVRGLPDDGVAHERGRGRQVAGDGREVERGDGVDEALERAVVAAVPQAAGVGRRLLLDDLAGEVDVEAPEVDELAGGVDLGLVGRLALPEHRRGVDPRPPRPGEQVGGLEEDRGAVVEGQVAPRGGGGDGGIRGGGGVGLRRAAGHPEHLAVRCGWRTSIFSPVPVTRAPPIVWGSSWRSAASSTRATSSGALGAARGVVEDGLVGRGGDVGDSVHAVGLLVSGHDVGITPTLAPGFPGDLAAARRGAAGRPTRRVAHSTRATTAASSVTSYQSRSVGSVAPGSSSTWKDTRRRSSTGADTSTRADVR